MSSGKRCSKCKQHKDVTHFTRNRTKADGLASWCKSCMSQYHSSIKERLTAYKKKYYQANKKKIYQKHKAWISKNPERVRQHNRRNSLKYKLSAIAAYSKGANECVCCGEREIAFLSLDHIKDDGAEHRRIAGSGSNMYVWAHVNGYPPGLQVMCFNCNLGRYVNGGVCPHKQPIDWAEKFSQMSQKRGSPLAARQDDSSTGGRDGADLMEKLIELEAARDIEENCIIGAGAGFDKDTREISEQGRNRDNKDTDDPGRVSLVTFAGLHCHQDGCIESLTLERTTAVTPTHEDDWRMLMPALYEATVFLGWRVYHSMYWCPTHVVFKKLACSRCRMPCPACSCMGSPRIDAVDGDDGDADDDKEKP